MDILFTIILFLFCLWLLACLLLNLFVYFYSYKMIYHPYDEKDNLSELNLSFKNINLKTSYNVSLDIWYCPPKNNMPTIVYLHGRSYAQGWRSERYKKYAEKGYGLICPTYRYNGNEKNASTISKVKETDIINDCLSILRWVENDLKIPSDKTFLYGESLGTSIATQLAVIKNNYKGLILEVPFDSMINLFNYKTKIIPIFRVFCSHKYETIKYINDIQIPVLIGGAEFDKLVPVEMSKKLFDSVNSKKKLVIIENSSHMGLYNTNKWFEEVVSFVENGL